MTYKNISLPNALNLSSSSIISECNDFLHTVQSFVQGIYFCPHLTPGTLCPTGTQHMALQCIGGDCKKTTRSPFGWGSQDLFLGLRIKWHLSHLILDLYEAGPHARAKRQYLEAGGTPQTDGLTRSLVMTVPWLMMTVTISGNWFRCPGFLSTRLSPLETRLPSFCPQTQLQIPSSNLEVSSLNVSVLTWRLIKMIRGFMPLLNLFFPDAEVMVFHVTAEGRAQQIVLSLPNFYMASGEKVVLPAVPLNSAGILSARKILSYLQTNSDSQSAPEMWLSCNQAVRLTPLEVLVFCSHADCSAMGEQFSFLTNMQKNPVSTLISLSAG